MGILHALLRYLVFAQRVVHALNFVSRSAVCRVLYPLFLFYKDWDILVWIVVQTRIGSLASTIHFQFFEARVLN
jgi:hypothetical protein